MNRCHDTKTQRDDMTRYDSIYDICFTPGSLDLIQSIYSLEMLTFRRLKGSNLQRENSAEISPAETTSKLGMKNRTNQRSMCMT